MNSHILFTVVWFHTLVVLFGVSVIAVHKWPFLWNYMMALFLGIIIGIIDLAAEELQFTVLLLLMFGFFSGFNQPKHAWRWALLLGIWTPIFGIIKNLPTQDFDKLIFEGFGAFLALIPAFIGAYIGVLLKTTSNRKQKSAETTA